MKPGLGKYLIVFIITVFIFATAIYLSNFINNRKLVDLKEIQNAISVDLLSSETQFSLLEELSCDSVKENTVLSSELRELGEKIEFSERNFGNSEEVKYLRDYYSLLEIKDYLLMKKISERCNIDSVFILYFYSNEGCDDCGKQGLTLTALKEKYPDLRVYSFDFDSENSAVKTLKTIYKAKEPLPALISNQKVFNGYYTAEELEEMIPELKTILPPSELEAEDVTEPQNESN